MAEAAKLALEFLSTKHQSVKGITTKGTILNSTTFTAEEEASVGVVMTNDDKILATCLTLCKGSKDQIEGKNSLIEVKIFVYFVV